MKSIFPKYILAAALTLPVAGMFGSCNEELDQPPLDIPVSTWTANTSILSLKQQYWQEDRNYAVEVTAPIAGDRVIIGGRVIASDSTGNIFKTVILQDETSAIAIAVDTTKLYLRYKQGEQMLMDVTGLFVGKYNGLLQIGNCQVYGSGYETAQMKGSQFVAATQLNGLPDQSYIDTLDTSIAEILSWKTADRIIPNMSRLIRLTDVCFVGGGELPYSEMSASSNRELQDAYGNKLTVRNSSYATFARDIMPAGYGTVVCILSYYGTGWQLLLRSAVDVYGFSGDNSDIPASVKAECVRATAVKNGNRIALVGPDNGVVVPIAADKNYGYLTTEPAIELQGAELVTRKSSLFTLTETDKGWLMVDAYGRYLSLEGSYPSFQLYDNAPADGSYWDITVGENGMTSIVNKMRAGATIRWADSYNNFSTNSTGNGALPVVYICND